MHLDPRKAFALLGQADCSVGGKRAEVPGSKGCDQQYKVQSVTSGIPQLSVAELMLVYLCATDLDTN